MVSLLDQEKGQVVYSLETFVGIWRITQNPNVLWIRGREAAREWKEIGVFPSPEEATFAVGSGKTRVSDWDVCPHRPEDFALARWNRMSA